ncbi:MAG: FAD-dependent oxidoreductase, partial [Alphaproteobacteria bacterium]|nr:FAD-dependent oxidoreductase [Alphaproteobacteria bacterium]
MDSPATPIVKDLVLIGGGHAHVQVLKNFGMRPMPGVRLTLIARDIDTPYSGMLPGYIAGHYSFDDCHIDLAPLARFAGVRLYHTEAIAIDRSARSVLCRERPPVPYDVLSIDIGSRPKAHDVPGAAEHATPVKPIDRFAARWLDLVSRVGSHSGPFRIGVVGGGAGGVEVLLAMRHRLRALDLAAGRDPDRLSFLLVTAGALLATHTPKVAAIFGRVLAERGVEIRVDAPV